jgi:hypothetical membrane protein
MPNQPGRDLLKRRLIMIGGVAGIVLPIFFGAMWFAAVVVNGHWVLGEHTLSELGGQVPSRVIFNTAAIISGLLGIDFCIGLMAHFAPSGSGIAGSALLATASFGLIMVGIFPIDTGESHTLATAFFFGFAALAVLTLAYPVHRWVGTKGAPFIVLIAALVLSIISIALTPIPFAEAVTVASLLALSLTLGIRMVREAIRGARTS